MNSIFVVFVSILILQRVTELYIAKKNEKYMLSLGGVEIGANHYKYIVILHTLFFLALMIEVVIFKSLIPAWWTIPLTAFVLAQILRVWCIKSLGRYWNTKIIVLPGADVIQKGPYKYLRHPNYLVVITELLAIPLIFGAYYTAFFITVLNAIMLSIRIKTEETALGDLTVYDEAMQAVPRFVPSAREKI